MVDDLLKELEKGIKAQKAQRNVPKQDAKSAPKLNIDVGRDHKVNVSSQEEEVKEISFKFHPRTIERFAYLFAILLLLGYIGYDFAFLHGSGATAAVTKSVEQEKTEAAAAKEEPKPAAQEAVKPVPAPVVEEKKEEPKPAVEAPKVQLSGKIDIKIVSVDKEKKSETLGSVNSVTFSIENGKDAVFFPHVTVVAYDKTTEETMSDKSRGTYTYPSGIESGKKQTGTISLTPKSFSNLNQEKTLILYLREKNAEGKVLTTATSNFLID